MEYTAQNLEYAVSVFYNGEQVERAKAHAWLTAGQRAPEAWKFLWELLQPTKSTEIQFYGATTLHTKILRCWNELPPESYEELKNKLLQAIFAYSKGPKIVTNRLCISLAAFILQQGTLDFPAILRPLSTIENSSLLLDVLTVMPEEYNSMTMGSALRAKNRAALQQACPAVLDDMLGHLQSAYNKFSAPPSEELVQSWTAAALCASSWLMLGGDDSPDSIIPLPDRMPLCRALLTAVHVLYTWNEAVSDTVLDACESCLAAVRAAGGGSDAARYSHAALQLLTLLGDLAAPIMQRDNVPNSINEEIVSALITCCVALGETHSRALVQAIQADTVEAPGEAGEEQRGARQLLQLLLAAQAAPGHYPLHETRSNLVFGFWYTLQDEVLNLVMDGSHDIHPLWKDVFSQLLMILINKSEVPVESALSRDDHELLRCYRQDIADTVMYCFAVVGEWCWSSVEATLQGATSETRREAVLHVTAALADAAPHEHAPRPLLALLDHAVATVHSADSARILNTALDCLGGYASWLSSVQSARAAALSRECVRAAGGALDRAPAPAALALRKLCAECIGPAADLVADIVQAAQSACVRRDAWVRRQVASAAGAALAAAPLAAAAPLLRDFAATLRDDLAPQRMDANAICGSAECVAALLAALAPRPQLAAALFRDLAPTLPGLAQNHSLVEPMFNILKQTVSTLMDDCMQIISEIAQLIVTGFNCFPSAAGLDVVKLVVLMVGGSWAGASALLHATVDCSARALAPDPSARPDLTEGLFCLLHALTKKKPQFIDWIDDLLYDLIQLGVSCVRMWEAGGSRGACAWLAALAARRPRTLLPHAPTLTAHALRCIGGATPRNQIEPLAELLLALNRAQWSDGAGAGADAGGDAAGGGLAAWLRQALAVQGFPTRHATDAHKHKFIAAVIKEKSSKRRLLETVQEFSLACRGLIGTEYARQTLGSKQFVA
ncbi:importin-13 [Manduca sexta]|uniref:importin-13 n=1 Tax=Manduca sexta TaxID=7130 RepID=UPI00188FC9A7|nr:importin-13 [Manduca sexta]